MNKVVTRLVIPGLIVLAGVGISGAMVASKPKAERDDGEATAVLVEVVTVEAEQMVAKLGGTGIVEPARQVSLAFQVPGSLVWVSEEAVPGGRFAKGELVARVDPQMYELAVKQAEGTATRAELDLQLEQSRKSIAEREWELLGEGKAASEAPLALREPQLATAEVAAASARSALERVQLDLSRTELRAPFNAVVVEELLEVGQLVGSAGTVITMVGTDAARVKVSLPVEKLSLVELPEGGRPGSAATITQLLGDGSQVVREGRVHRLVGQLDPSTRTATLLVQVDSPMEGEGLPLLPGAFVSVDIEGILRDDIVAIPRQAVSEGSLAWVVGPGDILECRTLDVAWGTMGSVFVSEGLKSGDRVVTSALSLPMEGQVVRVSGTETATVTAGEEGR